MKFEIKHRFTGKVLFSLETKSLKVALELAIERDTNLRGADLRGANLRGAKGVNKYITTPLYLLLEQTGKIRAYKLTNADNEGPYYAGIKYIVGETVKAKANTDENRQCAAGISIATLDWCIKEWKQGYKIKVVEFTKKDIAAIPIGSDGKFRVSKCKVIKNINLEKIGLIKK